MVVWSTRLFGVHTNTPRRDLTSTHANKLILQILERYLTPGTTHTIYKFGKKLISNILFMGNLKNKIQRFFTLRLGFWPTSISVSIK